MAPQINNYCGDEEMARMLEKSKALISLNQVYGLFYALVSAPELVMPSKYYNLIFNREGGSFETIEAAQTVMNNLMSLWNELTHWDPKEDGFIYPLIKYERDINGLTQRLRDNAGLIEYYLKGLELAGVNDSDFPGNNPLQVDHLRRMHSRCSEVIELFEGDEEIERLDKWNDTIDKMEQAFSTAICDIYIDLKDARDMYKEQLHKMSSPPPAKSTKIPRNSPCPCGSGKKYKKCCGIVH